MSGDSGPSSAQKAAQSNQEKRAQAAEAREISRNRSLHTRILARQRSRRFGQFGRRSLAFNPGNKDLGTTAATPDPVDPTAPGAKNNLSGSGQAVTKQQARIRESNARLHPKLFAKAEARRARQGKTTVAADTAPPKPAQTFRAVSA